VSWLDLILVLLLALTIPAGYRRGAVVQVCGLAGLIAGLALGAYLAPKVAGASQDHAIKATIALGVLVTAAAAGNLLGNRVGTGLRKRAKGAKVLGRADSVGGALVSAFALFLATWFLALNLASGPFPAVARAIQRSRIVAVITNVMPQPPSLVGGLRSVLNTLGFPDVFIGVPPLPAPPVNPPSTSQRNSAVSAASPSMVEVLGDGCYTGFYDEGSGFVVAPHYVITNAHVIGGTSRQWVNNGKDLAASVVAFDPAMDVTILYVPDLSAPVLPRFDGEVSRGSVGAVLGYPGGEPLTGVKAAVRQTIDAVGRDIYGRGDVNRRLYEVQATIVPGNSGGPFVLPNGKVAGLIFASSTSTDQLGYAMVMGQLEPFIAASVKATQPVGTQACAH
jgi:S1-C subfamily serine protease